jgi:hypothetical protein
MEGRRPIQMRTEELSMVVKDWETGVGSRVTGQEEHISINARSY